MDVVDRHPVVACGVLLHIVRGADEIVVGAQLASLAKHAREVVEKAHPKRVLRPCQFTGCDPVASEAVDLFVNCLHHLCWELASSRSDFDTEESVQPNAGVPRVWALRDLIVVDKAFVEARVLVAGQDVGEGRGLHRRDRSSEPSAW